jgi:lysophospholipase L1-like esterase
LASNEPQPASSDVTKAPSRRWLLRLLAIAFSCALFAALEGILIGLDVAPTSPADDPFVGFASIEPLFVLEPTGERYHTAPTRRGFFAEESFAAVKSDQALRVFVVGGSTVQGRPFSIETSFPGFLEVALAEVEDDRTSEVVNCGGISYASYRLIPIVREILQYDPDLIIVCTGHNEFLERVEYPDLDQVAGALPFAFRQLNRLRSFRAVRRLVVAQSSDDQDSPSVSLATEADAQLDHQGGLDAYHRNDKHAARVAEHFAIHLRRISRLTKQAQVPLLLVLPPGNLSDCPPFKSEFSAASGADVRQQIVDLIRDASLAASARPTEAVTLLQHAVELDPRYAMSWYQLGKLLEAEGRFDEATTAYQQAVDNDICPLRMTSPLQQSMRQVAATEKVPLIDAHQLISRLSPHDIAGGDRMVDHVHPSFRGHQEIAFAILQWMAETGTVAPLAETARDRCQDRWNTTIQTLDSLYFLRGRRALQDLQEWAAGRVNMPPMADEPPASKSAP